LEGGAEGAFDVSAKLHIVPRVHRTGMIPCHGDRGATGATSDGAVDQGAPRPRRGAPSDGGVGAIVGAPISDSRARRPRRGATSDGGHLGGPLLIPLRATAAPGGDARWGAGPSGGPTIRD